MGEFYLRHEYWFAVFQLVTAMFGMGATLEVKRFQEVVLEPVAVTYGTLIQLLLVPAIAYLFVSVLELVPGVAIGIALIAAVPGGSSSNIFTYFCLGNVALSISVTALTTLACLVTTPFVLHLLISDYMPTDFVMPTAVIMKEIVLTLLLPLIVGMIALRLVPSTSPLLAKWSIRGSLLGLFMIFFGSLSSGRLDIDAFGLVNIGAIYLFLAVITFAGWFAPRVVGLARADASAIEMEVIVRNINLGIMLKVLLFPTVVGQDDPLGDMALFSLLLYGGAQLVNGAILVLIGQKLGATKSPASNSFGMSSRCVREKCD